MTLDPKTLKKLADQFDELAASLTAIGGTFRDAAGSGGDKAGNGKPAGTKSRAGSPAPVETGADDEVTEDSLRDDLRALADAKGKDVMLEALEHVGAAKLSDVDESQYADLKEKIDELAAAEEAEPEPAKKAPAKKTAKKTAKKAVTLEELQEAAKELIDADKPEFLKLSKKFGKPSECDEGTYAEYLEAIKGAMPATDGDDELL